MRIASHPFAPGHIILKPALLFPYLCNFFAMGGYFATLFYVPLYFQVVSRFTAASAGIYLIPAIIGSVTGSVSGGLIMQKTGKYYILTVFAYTCLALGHIPLILCSGVAIDSAVGMALGLVVCGFGGGIGVTTSLIALISNADPADQAIVTACSYLFRSLGSVIGVSLSATIMQQSLRTQLRRRLGDGRDADRIVEGVRESLEYLEKLSPHLQELVRGCYQKACQGAFVFAFVGVSLAMVCSVFLREKKLSR